MSNLMKKLYKTIEEKNIKTGSCWTAYLMS